MMYDEIFSEEDFNSHHNYAAEAEQQQFLQRISDDKQAKKDHAIAFAKWINREGWREYDEADRWIQPHVNRHVFNTAQLYKIFEKATI